MTRQSRVKITISNGPHCSARTSTSHCKGAIVTGYFESLINDVPGNADSLTSLAGDWDTYGNTAIGEL